MVEKPHDRAGGSHLRAGFGEAIADIGNRPHVVVGQAVDDNHAATGAEAFVASGDEVFAAHALGLLDRLFNDVARHLVALRFFDQTAQGRIGVWVRDPVLGQNVQLLAVLGVDLRLHRRGLEDRSFTIFEISAHGNSTGRVTKFAVRIWTVIVASFAQSFNAPSGRLGAL
jgi:hypothetical protein